MNCARSQFRPESNCFKYFLVDLILRDFEIYWTVLVYYKLNTHDECGPALWQRLYVHTKRRVAIHLGQLGICIFNCLPSVTQNSYHYPECHNANARQHSYE